MRAHLSLIGLTATALSLASPPARAQTDTREVDAKKACLGGHPDRGIELLADLYAETNDPTYIYNQARCFEQNGRGAEAVTRFREYLRKATSIGADERAQVQARIDALEADAHAAAPPVVQPLAPAAAPVPVLVAAAADSAAREARARHLRIAALSAGAVGVVAAVFGVVEGLRARSLSQEVTNDAKNGIYVQSKFDDGSRAQTLEVIGYSVAGAGLVAAGVLYGLSRVRGDEAPVSAMIDGTGARALWRFRF